MKNIQAQKLFQEIKITNERLSTMTSAQRKSLEKTWDIEHAYYSSALEGSKITRREYEKLAKTIA